MSQTTGIPACGADAMLYDATLSANKAIQAFLSCNSELQHAARKMMDTINDPNASDEERTGAVLTLREILFPERPDAGAALEDVDLMAIQNQPDGAAARDELDAEEETFSQRLRDWMAQKNMTQAKLADAIGIGQPAISMMLNRAARPQRSTVVKMAEALGVEPAELWPLFEG